MQLKTIELTQAVRDYVLAHSAPLGDHHLRLIAETHEMFPEAAELQIPPEQGLFLRMLARLARCRRILEVGTFTGLSAMFLAEGLAEGGRVVCIDLSREWTALAQRHWENAGLADRIELRLGRAAQVLAGMEADDRFDLAFIDADKAGYIDYYEAIVPRVPPGGLIVADNTLRRGLVADPAEQDQTVVAIRAFNDHLAADPRVEVVVLPLADGLSLARVR